MKKILVSIAILTLACLSSLVTANTAVPSPTAKKADVDLLFIQVAKHGSLTPIKDKPGFYELKLQGVDAYVQYFSNRPVRITGLYPTSKFSSNWEKGQKPSSFNKMPPNAALSAVELHLIKNKMVNIVLQLSSPIYNAQKHTLTYTAQILANSKNQVPMKHMEHIALFIDSYCASCVGKGF
jgi:hypothetical protein